MCDNLSCGYSIAHHVLYFTTIFRDFFTLYWYYVPSISFICDFVCGFTVFCGTWTFTTTISYILTSIVHQSYAASIILHFSSGLCVNLLSFKQLSIFSTIPIFINTTTSLYKLHYTLHRIYHLITFCISTIYLFVSFLWIPLYCTGVLVPCTGDVEPSTLVQNDLYLFLSFIYVMQLQLLGMSLSKASNRVSLLACISLPSQRVTIPWTLSSESSNSFCVSLYSITRCWGTCFWSSITWTWSIWSIWRSASFSFACARPLHLVAAFVHCLKPQLNSSSPFLF